VCMCMCVCACVCVCVCVCVRVCVCECVYAHRSIQRQRPCRFVGAIGGFYDVGSIHSTDFGLGWEQVNLVVVRWGSRIKVRDHLLDTRVGRRSPPVPHLLQSWLGRRLQSLKVLAFGLGPTHSLDVGSVNSLPSSRGCLPATWSSLSCASRLGIRRPRSAADSSAAASILR